MIGIVIDPGKAPEICRLPDTSQQLDCWLDGTAKMRPFGRYPAALLYTVCQGAALPNRYYIDHWYYGRLIIVGYKSRRMMSLPKELATQLARQWEDVEVMSE